MKTGALRIYAADSIPIILFMTALYQDLQKVGLTANQSAIYLALAKVGSAKAGALIKKTGMHRNLVYGALDELVRMRLVSASKIRGVAAYTMLSPTHLLDAVAERERVAKSAIEELQLLSGTRARQEVLTYEGAAEFRLHTIRSFDVAKPGSLIRYLGTSPRWHSVIDKETEQELVRMQKEKKLRLRGIAAAPFKEIQPWLTATKSLTELRYNPLVGSDTNNVEILDDRICIQSFAPPYLVVEIVNAEVAKNYQAYFDFLWLKSK